MKKEIGMVVGWNKVDKEDYLFTMERSPIEDIKIKHILKAALTDKINVREVFMKDTTATTMMAIRPLKQKNYNGGTCTWQK